MKSIHDYIVHIDGAFHETITTDSGFELYLDKRMNAKELANTKGVIVETPVYIGNPIPIGSEVIIDSTVLLSQSYKGNSQESTFIADKEKGWYFVDRSLILMYKENKVWNCYGQNLFVKPIKAKHKKPKGSIITLEKKNKYLKNRAKVVFLNDYLRDSDVRIGEELYIKPNNYIEYKINGEKYWWIRNTDIIASEVKSEAI